MYSRLRRGPALAQAFIQSADSRAGRRTLWGMTTNETIGVILGAVAPLGEPNQDG